MQCNLFKKNIKKKYKQVPTHAYGQVKKNNNFKIKITITRITLQAFRIRNYNQNETKNVSNQHSVELLGDILFTNVGFAPEHKHP